MLYFEENRSPYFAENKEYCVSILNDLELNFAQVQGVCSAYGYDLNMQLRHEKYTIHLRLLKTHTTEGGSFVHMNSNMYSGIVVRINGFNAKMHCTIGRSKWKRIFRANTFYLPSSWYISGKPLSSKTNVQNGILWMQNNYISSARLRRGNWKIVAHSNIFAGKTFLMELVNILELLLSPA